MRDRTPLRGLRVTLCVTGSIAAYRGADICSKLVQAGAVVYPQMTPGACGFLHPRTLATLAGNPCPTSLEEDGNGSNGVAHVARGQDTDVILVAPASANQLAKLAHGLCDDMVSATCLAATAPIVVCPAMNTAMWGHPATQANVSLLVERGVRFVPPRFGKLACGSVGDGKIAETDDILDFLAGLASAEGAVRLLSGKRVLVTAGGTREPIDSVRYIGNASTGKMGAALAAAALALGADVDVVCGPGTVPMPREARCVPIATTQELLSATLERAPAADLVLMAAAPADYRVSAPIAGKHKKSDGTPVLELIENPDILARLVESRRPGQCIIGFAAEAGDPAAEAIRKCARKGCDLIVGNNIASRHGAFGSESTELVVCDQDRMLVRIGPCAKRAAADQLMQFLLTTRLAEARP